jgi:hypothetical protein
VRALLFVSTICSISEVYQYDPSSMSLAVATGAVAPARGALWAAVKSSQSILHWAALYGATGGVQALLEHKDALMLSPAEEAGLARVVAESEFHKVIKR